MQQSLFSEKGMFGETDRNPDRPHPVANRQVLNEAQYQAVTTLDGPVLVVAGAGTGKTRTLVYRVAHLIERGTEPEHILLLTFTRKAAQEMLHRAGQLLGASCSRVTGGTFHAVANLLLRRHGRHLGYPSHFTIIDRADAEGIITILKSALAMGGAGKRFPSKHIIVNIISKAVNKGVSIDDLLVEEYEHLTEFGDDIVKLRDHYQSFKFEHGLMDYDDLLVNLQRVLVEVDPIREQESERFSHIMVDEYQDTNLIQAEIVRLLASCHGNVMAVGDDAQSIYSFRGADFKNIMNFPRLFPGTRIIKLEENYRSTQPVLSLTNAIIERATEKYTKKLFTSIAGGEKPQLFSGLDPTEEARFIIDRIASLQRQGLALHNMAVLFRSGFHSFKLELELAARHIPFEKRGGLKLTEAAHIKDLISYFRVLVNPRDNLSWNRILLHLDKVGPKTARKILADIKAAEEPLNALADYPAAGKFQAALANLADLLLALSAPNIAPVVQFERVLEYYRPIFERIYYDDYPKRSRDLEQLKVIIQGYGDLQSFVADTALEPPEIGGDIGDSEDRLVLSTIHSAKGLEWHTVFVINLVDGKFPVSYSMPGEQLEEERRLLYVAATRAKHHLILTYPREIMSQDRRFVSTRLSPFLAELPAGLYELIGREVRCESAGPADRGPGSGKPLLFDPRLLREGAPVEHPFFGPGRIESISGPRRVEVLFARHGRKTLHLDYAKLKFLG